MGARYPYYLLADSPEGQRKEAEIGRNPPKTTPTFGFVRQGFVYERVPHITLKSIANNAEIDAIWERMQPAVEAALGDLNRALAGHGAAFRITAGARAGTQIDFVAEGEVRLRSGEMAPAGGLMEWEVPREAPAGWPAAAQQLLSRFWHARINRQKEMDASIRARPSGTGSMRSIVASHSVQVIGRLPVRVRTEMGLSVLSSHAVRVRDFAAIRHSHCCFEVGEVGIPVQSDVGDVAVASGAGINDFPWGHIRLSLCFARKWLTDSAKTDWYRG